MISGKEQFVASLLSPNETNSTGKKSLITEIGKEEDPKPQPEEAKVIQENPNDGPSMLEMMMEAQKLASKEKSTIESKKIEAESKKGFGGFKKGFFGSSSSSSSSKSSTNTSKQSTKASTKNDIIEVKAQPSKQKSNLTFQEVQEKMEEEKSPLLKQLQSQGKHQNRTLKYYFVKSCLLEWMTPTLVDQFKSNPILSKGFQDPKCLAAIQLMQKDPKEALKRFQGDPVVGQFLQEFGKVMSGHFEALGQAQNPNPEPVSSSPAPIQEIGPLHAKALQNKSKINPPSTSTSIVESTQPTKATSQKPQETEEEKVQRVRTRTIISYFYLF